MNISRNFFHYSKKIEEIKRSKYINDSSYAKTNTYDFLLECAPSTILDKKESSKLKKYLEEEKEDIEKLSKKQKKGDYRSKYRKLKLKYKNRLLDEFFAQDKFVLALEKELDEGWIKWGMLPLLANNVGRKYLKFKITKNIERKSFVLEQKYWSPFYSINKFNINSWDPKFRVWEHPKIVKEIFGKYYNSIKRLSEYEEGEFEVPEFWIYGKIPVRECEAGEISEEELGKLLKERKKIKKLG